MKPSQSGAGLCRCMARLFRNPQQLLNRRASFEHLPQAVLREGTHAALDCLLLDDSQVRVIADQPSDRGIHEEQLEDAGASVESRAAAVLARLRRAGAFASSAGPALEVVDPVG